MVRRIKAFYITKRKISKNCRSKCIRKLESSYNAVAENIKPLHIFLHKS